MLLLLAFFTAASAQAADIAAMVTDLHGDVFSIQARARTPVAILSELAAGTRLVLEKEATLAIVYIKSGNEFHLTGPAQVEIANDMPRLSGAGKLVRQPLMLAAQGAKLEVRNGRVIQAAIVMRNDKTQTPGQIGPKGKTLTTRPVFQWAPVWRGRKTAFELFDVDAQVSVAEAVVDGTSFLLPDRVMLKPGRTYTWSISPEGSDGGNDMLTAGLVIATSEEIRRFAHMQPASGATFSQRLVYAALLEQAGFQHEAKAIWQALSAERPELNKLGEMAER